MQTHMLYGKFHRSSIYSSVSVSHGGLDGQPVMDSEGTLYGPTSFGMGLMVDVCFFRQKYQSIGTEETKHEQLMVSMLIDCAICS